jgi:hypothetical protein
MPSTPPLPPAAETPSTPPTSPQRHQQAARNQERNERHIGSPEQRRTPAILPYSSAPPPVIVGGRELNYLPLDMRMQMINVPPHQPLRRRGPAPPQPFPLPPLFPLPSPPPPFVSAANSSSVVDSGSAVGSGSGVGSSSMAPPALGSGFVPILPLPPPLPSPPSLSSRQTLNSAQLRALYVAHPIQRSTSRIPVSFSLLLFTNITNN